MESAVPASAASLPFPPKPDSVPADLANPSSKYKLHAWMALGGLLLFGTIYVGLAAWFSYSAYRLWGDGMEFDDPFLYLESICSGILAIFLIKGLFFKKRSTADEGFEITAKDEPALFEFIDRVADETGAPKPHRVYLSPSVNACVFYDLSLINFLIPTKKNLDIGLGLVNVLTLSEFKAVLSHEFGHFAQKTMAVGRWVYVAQQVANQLIYHRDALDKFLNIISGIDLRIAWIGWVLRLIVWSLRSILDSLLSIVMLAERALSREMEFQADLVAVSTSGSDALIHGLYRLPAADGAWSDTLDFLSQELGEERKVANAFAIQSRILEHQKRILNDPDFGTVPPLPDEGRESHRVFSADIAQPPQMWATHPLSHFREANAKDRYIPAALDDRSAWSVFQDPVNLCERLTAYMLEGLEQKKCPLEESIKKLDSNYAKEYYDPRYRGMYLERSVCDHAESVDDLFTLDEPPVGFALYPETLVDDLERLRNTEKERSMLVALRDRTLETPDGIIRFRGDVIKRSHLGEAIETSEKDLESCRSRLREHDRYCHGYFMRIARSQPDTWGAYLKGLMKLLHYSDHKLRDILDANRKLSNTYAVVVADGNVSNKELNRLLADARELYTAIGEIYSRKSEVILDPTIQKRMPKPTWSENLEEEFNLPAPVAENVGNWLQVLDGWIGATCSPLAELREAALEELLEVETRIFEANRNGIALGGAPTPSNTPSQYATLLHGNERELQNKLGWWDSFQTASGTLPASLRFLISAAIVGSAIYITLPPEWRHRIVSLFT